MTNGVGVCLCMLWERYVRVDKLVIVVILG